MCSQPPYQRLPGVAFGIFVGEDRALGFQTAGLTKFSLAISSMFSCWRSRSRKMVLAISDQRSSV